MSNITRRRFLEDPMLAKAPAEAELKLK